jgi:hypothetical protein
MGSVFDSRHLHHFTKQIGALSLPKGSFPKALAGKPAMNSRQTRQDCPPAGPPSHIGSFKQSGQAQQKLFQDLIAKITT